MRKRRENRTKKNPDGELQVWCPRCETWKSPEDFRETKNGFASYCMECRREYDRHRERKLKRTVKLRIRVLNELGHECYFCDMAQADVLEVHNKDHVQAKRQREWGLTRRQVYYDALKHPDRYILLCKNCRHLRRS